MSWECPRCMVTFDEPPDYQPPEAAAALHVAIEALEEIKALPGRVSDTDAAWGIANEALQQLADPTDFAIVNTRSVGA